jgi:hypothetical protein
MVRQPRSASADRPRRLGVSGRPTHARQTRPVPSNDAPRASTHDTPLHSCLWGPHPQVLNMMIDASPRMVRMPFSASADRSRRLGSLATRGGAGAARNQPDPGIEEVSSRRTAARAIARNDDLETLACEPLEMVSVEREDPLRTAFACTSGDHSVMARGAGDLALAETLDQLPGFLSIKPNDDRPLAQGTLQDCSRILPAEPMRPRQPGHHRIGFDERLEREDDIAGLRVERCQLSSSRFVVLVRGEEAGDDDAGIEGCRALNFLTLHARGPGGESARPSPPREAVPPRRVPRSRGALAERF